MRSAPPGFVGGAALVFASAFAGAGARSAGAPCPLVASPLAPAVCGVVSAPPDDAGGSVFTSVKCHSLKRAEEREDQGQVSEVFAGVAGGDRRDRIRGQSQVREG